MAGLDTSLPAYPIAPKASAKPASVMGGGQSPATQNALTAEQGAITAANSADTKQAAAIRTAGEANVGVQNARIDYDQQLRDKEAAQLAPLDQGPFKPEKPTLASMGALFTMVAMVGAFLGSKGGTSAAANAQAALTGMVKGWNDGNEELVRQQKAVYDTNAAYLKDKADKVRQLIQEYREDAVKDGIPTALGRFAQNAKTRADADVLASVAEKQGPERALKLAEDTVKAAEQADLKSQEFAQSLYRQDRGFAHADATKDAGAMDPQAMDYYAMRSIFTGKDPTFGMGAAGARTSFMNYVAQKAKALGLTPQQAAAFQAGIGSNKVALNAITKVTTAVQAQEKTMLDNIKVAEKLQPDAQKSALPALNKWLQTGSTQLGLKDAPPYAASIITVADQYAKILSGSTGAAGSTDAARKQAFDLISPYLNSGQIGGVYDVLKQDSENKRAEYEGVRQELLSDIGNTGGGGKQLSGEDQKALDWANSNPNDPRAKQIHAHLGQ